jgi:DNA-binding response OmpR family regulator
MCIGTRGAPATTCNTFMKTPPVVYVIAPDWTMRTAVRAELREMGVEALGMDSADDAGRAMSSGRIPDAVVVEATAELLDNPGIQTLVRHVPAVLIASRTVKVSLPEAPAVLYRPVRVAEVVARVNELLAREHGA